MAAEPPPRPTAPSNVGNCRERENSLQRPIFAYKKSRDASRAGLETVNVNTGQGDDRIVGGGNMPEENWLRRLSRAKDDRWIGGVCGGLGKHTPVPSWTWRVIFSLAFFCLGTGLLIYILLWLFMPKET